MDEGNVAYHVKLNLMTVPKSNWNVFRCVFVFAELNVADARVLIKEKAHFFLLKMEQLIESIQIHIKFAQRKEEEPH